MTKTLLALGVATIALSSAPASADHGRHYSHHARSCERWWHGHCVRWNNHGYMMSTSRHAMWNTGYRFGPSYGYTTYSTLPRTYVQRYDLSPNYRYVYRDNYIYQVDPTTYAVTRVIDALTH